MHELGEVMLDQHSLIIADDRTIDVALDPKIPLRLAQTVVTRRLELGLSCSSVASSIGEAEETLSALESGDFVLSAVRLRFILRLAKALALPPKELFVTLESA